MDKLKELDTVALLKAFPEKRLFKGQVGTIVEQLDENTNEVEFSNKKDETFLTTSIKGSNLMLLHLTPF